MLAERKWLQGILAVLTKESPSVVTVVLDFSDGLGESVTMAILAATESMSADGWWTGIADHTSRAVAAFRPQNVSPANTIPWLKETKDGENVNYNSKPWWSLVENQPGKEGQVQPEAFFKLFNVETTDQFQVKKKWAKQQFYQLKLDPIFNTEVMGESLWWKLQDTLQKICFTISSNYTSYQCQKLQGPKEQLIFIRWREDDHEVSEAITPNTFGAPGANHEAKLLQSCTAEEKNRDTQMEEETIWEIRHSMVCEDKQCMRTNAVDVYSFCLNYILSKNYKKKISTFEVWCICCPKVFRSQ